MAMDKKPIDKSTTNYSINIPKSYNLLIPKNGFTAKQNNIPLIISNKSRIKYITILVIMY